MSKPEIHNLTELVDKLLDEIAVLTGYERPNARPNIIPLSVEKLQSFLSQTGNSLAYLTEALYLSGDALGFKRGTLLWGVQGNDDRWVRSLAHELVHFVQDWNGRMKPPVHDPMEQEAYELMHPVAEAVMGAYKPSDDFSPTYDQGGPIQWPEAAQ